MKMTSPFSAKLIVSVITLLGLIYFSSVCDAMRMLREENYQGKGEENDNFFKEEKDSTPASPNIGSGFPFTFNFPPFNMPFNIPKFSIPGFGSGGLPGFGSPATGAGGLPGFGIPGTSAGGLPGFGIPGAGGLPGFGIPSTGADGLPNFRIPDAGGLPGFGIPGAGGLPGFEIPGSGGLPDFGSPSINDNNPFTLSMLGVADVVVQPPASIP